MPTVTVQLEEKSYDIHIECGVLERAGEIVREAVGRQAALLAVDQKIAGTHGAIVKRSLRHAGYEVTAIELVADECEKSLATVRRIYDAMARSRLERRSPVVAVGGGIVGDTAGFAAATWQRGVPLVHVPTTLLAMADASIGGKTGVNLDLPSSSSNGGRIFAKNLIGAFCQPRAVLADPLTLRTLDWRDFRCGIAECIKHGLIADADYFRFLSERKNAIESMEDSVLVRVIERSASIKARIVERDPREESGERALLNLGHTFAHAIEAEPELDVRHGEAVAIGLCAAANVSVETSRMRRNEAGSVRDLVESFGLPARLPEQADVADLIDAMGYDKKISGGRLRLVLPVGIGRAEIVESVPPATIENAWRSVGAK